MSLYKIAYQIIKTYPDERRGVTAAFRYLTTQAKQSAEEARKIIKDILNNSV